MTQAALPPVVAAALTQSDVKVSSSFHGATIGVYGAVFGATDQPMDVVVIVRGPDQPVTLAKRQRRLGLWINSHPVTMVGVPGFYYTASTRPLARFTDGGTRDGLQLSFNHLSPFTDSKKVLPVDSVPLWQKAVLRLKAKAGLYASDPKGVRYVDGHLFRADIDLPAAAPIGPYRLDILLFENGKIIARRARDLTISKVGLERDTFELAHRHRWSYGLLSVTFALVAGALTAIVFRRD